MFGKIACALLKRRQTLRFKYLFAGGKLDFATFKSLDSIAERLDKGWTEVEEADLRERMAAYRDGVGTDQSATPLIQQPSRHVGVIVCRVPGIVVNTREFRVTNLRTKRP